MKYCEKCQLKYDPDHGGCDCPKASTSAVVPGSVSEADVRLNNLLSACKDLEQIQAVYDNDPWACGSRGDMADKWNEAIKNVVEKTRALKST